MSGLIIFRFLCATSKSDCCVCDVIFHKLVLSRLRFYIIAVLKVSCYTSEL